MFIDKITKEKKKYYGGGCKPKPYMEQKVQVWSTVKRKHFQEAMVAIREVLKQYK